MKLAVTTNGRLYRSDDGHYYTPIVYGYDFFQRYLKVFEEVRLIAHCEHVPQAKVSGMLQVDGPNLEIFELPFPHGKWDYIKKYMKIKRILANSLAGCVACVLRIPDQLAFQVFEVARKRKIPIGVEVTSNSWELFAPGTTKGLLRPVVRRLWTYLQKRACRLATATSYVTREALQKYYPPVQDNSHYTTYYSNVDTRLCIPKARVFGTSSVTSVKCLHVSGSISGVAKGHKELIEAAAILKEKGFHLDITLVGAGNLDVSLQRIIHDKELTVHYAGQLSPQQVVQEMQDNDLFIFPSYREGLPRVVVEAMANGMVCVATNIDGIAELLDEQMLVPPKKNQALADKLLWLLQKPDVMAQQSERNLLNAKEYSPAELEKRRNAFYGFLRQTTDDNNPRKIRFLLNTLEGGGAERVLVNLLSQLSPQEYKVSLVTVTGGVFAKEVPRWVKYRQIVKDGSGFLGKLLAKLAYKTPRKLFNWFFLGGHYDIEIAYMHGFPSKMMAVKCGKTSRVYTFVHGDCSRENTIQKMYQSKEQCLAEYNSFDKVCFVSQNSKDGFEQCFGKTTNGIIVHNIINAHDVIEKSHVPTSIHFSTEGIRMVSVGRLTAVKGYSRLLEIVYSLEKSFDFQLFIVGAGDEHSALSKMIEEKQIRSVKLLGFFDNPYCIMRQADLYVCSSYQEAYSTSVAEAVTLGIPVLTTKCAGMDEILDKGQYGMIVDNSDDALKERLQTILAEPNILSEYQKRCLAYQQEIVDKNPLGDYQKLF